MFLGVVQDDDSGRMVLEQMNDNAIANARTPASNYVDLCRKSRVSWLEHFSSVWQNGQRIKEGGTLHGRQGLECLCLGRSSPLEKTRK